MRGGGKCALTDATSEYIANNNYSCCLYKAEMLLARNAQILNACANTRL